MISADIRPFLSGPLIIGARDLSENSDLDNIPAPNAGIAYQQKQRTSFGVVATWTGSKR